MMFNGSHQWAANPRQCLLDDADCDSCCRGFESHQPPHLSDCSVTCFSYANRSAVRNGSTRNSHRGNTSPAKAVLALVILLLSACGGGEPEDGDIPQATRAEMAAAPVKVMEWGDSTAAGSCLSNGSSPSREAQKVLTFKGYNFDVRHEAVGGMPAVYLLNGRHPLHAGVPFRKFPSLEWADIGMVRSGINENRLGYTQDQFKAALQVLVNEHRAAGKVIILTTPSPLDPAVIGPGRVAYVEASAHTVRTVYLANRDVAVLCDQNRYAKEAGIVAWKLDGMHPNERAVVLEGRMQARCILRAAELLQAARL